MRTSEPEAAWTLTPAAKPGRIDIGAGAVPAGVAVSAEVTGSPEGLLLTLWGRCTAAEAGLTIDGDTVTAASLVTL